MKVHANLNGFKKVQDGSKKPMKVLGRLRKFQEGSRRYNAGQIRFKKVQSF